jgi:alpha-L-arabinofuranosidase
MNYITPSPKVAVLDVVASGSDDKVYIHVINRNFNEDEQVKIELTGFDNLSSEATLHSYTGNLTNTPAIEETGAYGEIKTSTLEVKRNSVKVTLPMRSVSVITVDLL